MSKPKPYIDTIRGKAYFVKTCVETKSGKWDDHWSTMAGEYVIHEGKNHHVYKVGYKKETGMGGHTIFSQDVDLRTMSKPNKINFDTPRGGLKMESTKRKPWHNGLVFCQHCGCSVTECKKMHKQIVEYCCLECKAERTG